MPATDDEIAQLANMVEGCETLALSISMANTAERLHGIVRELDDALGDRLVRKYRGRFTAGPAK